MCICLPVHEANIYCQSQHEASGIAVVKNASLVLQIFLVEEDADACTGNNDMQEKGKV